MATDAYQDALDLAKTLSRDEQLQLLRDLAHLVAPHAQPPSQLHLEGLGANVQSGIDAQQQADDERASWDLLFQSTLSARDQFADRIELRAFTLPAPG